MITDEMRREVAQKLRRLPIDMYNTIAEWEKNGLFISNDVNDEADYSQIHDAVFGCFPAEHMHPGDYEELHERLADLIDRPACRIIKSAKIYTAFGELIDTMNVYALSCGHNAVGFNKPDYCPKCGKMVDL